jgi:hypothetical protein
MNKEEVRIALNIGYTMGRMDEAEGIPDDYMGMTGPPHTNDMDWYGDKFIENLDEMYKAYDKIIEELNQNKDGE